LGFFHIVHIFSLFNLPFLHIVHILSLVNLPFFHIVHIISQFSSVFSKSTIFLRGKKGIQKHGKKYGNKKSTENKSTWRKLREKRKGKSHVTSDDVTFGQACARYHFRLLPIAPPQILTELCPCITNNRWKIKYWSEQLRTFLTTNYFKLTKCFISFIFTTERVFYNSHLYSLYVGSLLQLCSFCFTANVLKNIMDNFDNA
jgi:hypothetical protein